MNKYHILIIYFLFSIIISLPIFLPMINTKIILIKEVNKLLTFNFDIKSIALIFFSICLIISFDLFFFNKIKQKNNVLLLNSILGNRNIFTDSFLSFFSGYSEELFFRGYLFIIIYNMLKKISFQNDLILIFLIMIFVSIIFGLFHISQGKFAFLFSIVFSIVFFTTIIFSKTIWYAILGHAIFNYLEITIILPFQKKMIE